MAENEMVEQETTEQESPTVEQNQSEVEAPETAEKPVQTPEAEAEDVAPEQDKNWKATRERIKQLEEENARLKGEDKKREYDPQLDTAKKSPVVQPYLSSEDSMTLSVNEIRAVDKIPELDTNSDTYDELFDIAVTGEYRRQLDQYAKGQLFGQPQKLPNAYDIARRLKKDWDARFAKQEAVKQEKVEKAREAKKATVEAESRSDAGAKQASDQELEKLRYQSRQGKDDAIAERLVRSGL